MKSTTILLILVVLVIAVAMVSGAGRNKAERKAERKAARKAERRTMRQNCKYDKRNAVCDETLTPPKREAQLIPEESSDPSCPLTKLYPCKGGKNKEMKCRYKIKEAMTAPCNETTQTKTAYLKKGEGCPSEKQIPCSKGEKRRKNGNGMKCKYNWKERKAAVCNEETQMVTISLKPGQEDTGCRATKDVPCKKGRRRGNRGMNKL